MAGIQGLMYCCPCEGTGGSSGRNRRALPGRCQRGWCLIRVAFTLGWGTARTGIRMQDGNIKNIMLFLSFFKSRFDLWLQNILENVLSMVDE